MARRVRDSFGKQALAHVRSTEIAAMKASTIDQIAGKPQVLKGTAREKVGKGIDDKRLESGGFAEPTSGGLRKQVGEVDQGMGK
jgi:uncharacterized protein YjbJ (UPF0337 family)